MGGRQVPRDLDLMQKPNQAANIEIDDPNLKIRSAPAQR